MKILCLLGLHRAEYTHTELIDAYTVYREQCRCGREVRCHAVWTGCNQ